VFLKLNVSGCMLHKIFKLFFNRELVIKFILTLYTVFFIILCDLALGAILLLNFVAQ